MALSYLAVTTKIFGIKMIPYYYLREAKLRLENAKQAIDMMGGEDECQPMLLGQRDMLELEVEYYRERSAKFTIFLLTLVVFGVTLWYLNSKGIFHVW
jgi:uncharacterized protein with GYD domain